MKHKVYNATINKIPIITANFVYFERTLLEHSFNGMALDHLIFY